MPLASAVAAMAKPAIMAWEGSSSPLTPILTALGAIRPPGLSLVIGPEGGFTDEEVALAEAAGVRLASLGPRILRAETAGIALAVLALYHLGELQATYHAPAEHYQG